MSSTRTTRQTTTKSGAEARDRLTKIQQQVDALIAQLAAMQQQSKCHSLSKTNPFTRCDADDEDDWDPFNDSSYENPHATDRFADSQKWESELIEVPDSFWKLEKGSIFVSSPVPNVTVDWERPPIFDDYPEKNTIVNDESEPNQVEAKSDLEDESVFDEPIAKSKTEFDHGNGLLHGEPYAFQKYDAYISLVHSKIHVHVPTMDKEHKLSSWDLLRGYGNQLCVKVVHKVSDDFRGQYLTEHQALSQSLIQFPTHFDSTMFEGSFKPCEDEYLPAMAMKKDKLVNSGVLSHLFKQDMWSYHQPTKENYNDHVVTCKCVFDELAIFALLENFVPNIKQIKVRHEKEARIGDELTRANVIDRFVAAVLLVVLQYKAISVQEHNLMNSVPTVKSNMTVVLDNNSISLVRCGHRCPSVLNHLVVDTVQATSTIRLLTLWQNERLDESSCEACHWSAIFLSPCVVQSNLFPALHDVLIEHTILGCDFVLSSNHFDKLDFQLGVSNRISGNCVLPAKTQQYDVGHVPPNNEAKVLLNYISLSSMWECGSYRSLRSDIPIVPIVRIVRVKSYDATSLVLFLYHCEHGVIAFGDLGRPREGVNVPTISSELVTFTQFSVHMGHRSHSVWCCLPRRSLFIIRSCGWSAMHWKQLTTTISHWKFNVVVWKQLKWLMPAEDFLFIHAREFFMDLRNLSRVSSLYSALRVGIRDVNKCFDYCKRKAELLAHYLCSDLAPDCDLLAMKGECLLSFHLTMPSPGIIFQNSRRIFIQGGENGGIH